MLKPEELIIALVEQALDRAIEEVDAAEGNYRRTEAALRHFEQVKQARDLAVETFRRDEC